MSADNEYNANFDPNLVEQAGEWRRENFWYDRDPVMKAAADQLDAALDREGIPAGIERFDRITESLKESYPAHFYNVPDKKLDWNSIRDPAERAQAKAGFDKMKHRLQYSGKKISEEEFLKDYFS